MATLPIASALSSALLQAVYPKARGGCTAVVGQSARFLRSVAAGVRANNCRSLTTSSSPAARRRENCRVRVVLPERGTFVELPRTRPVRLAGRPHVFVLGSLSRCVLLGVAGARAADLLA